MDSKELKRIKIVYWGNMFIEDFFQNLSSPAGLVYDIFNISVAHA